MVQIAIQTGMEGTIQNIKLAHAKQDFDASVSTEFQVGAHVKAIFVEIWLLKGGQQPGSVIVTVEKTVSGINTMTFTQAATLHTYLNKNNILYTTQGVVGDANTNPVPFYRGWIRIPKGKQRFAVGDQLYLNVSSVTEDTTMCGLCIYKSYT